jgi:hypothetical protein
MPTRVHDGRVWTIRLSTGMAYAPYILYGPVKCHQNGGGAIPWGIDSRGV